jgi:hypothetical protein
VLLVARLAYNESLPIAVLFTPVVVLSRANALALNARYLDFVGAPNELIKIAVRKTTLDPTPPPGSDTIVDSRDLQQE